MNYSKTLWALAIGAAILVAPACNKDDHDQPVDVNIQSVTNKILEDSWRITSFIDGDDGDETSKFNGYVFTFRADGTLRASYNGTFEDGTWRVGTDDGRTELRISFNSSNDALEELDDEDWHVTEITARRIRAQDLGNGGRNDDEFIVFEKI